ncbi:MFS transporter [Streptomyces sp. SL13]|uniref:MFS transporter n=1 Tax=Streptantibioticus silvisoli TaxID=2705255 RepID=A0AA90H9G1_9ACTN|nr:MFS transporter [Streptantibioticus silvisoli]MDI5973600.1 MFS transporter [Streptantibioticus silvisoli]
MLRDRDYALVISGQALSTLGDWLLLIAAPYYVLKLTGSTLATSLSMAAETVPALLIGPIAGVLADRWDRRTTMIVTDLLRAAAIAVLLCVHRPGQVWIIYAALVAEAAFSQFFTPSRQALIPVLVGRGGKLTEANAFAALVSGVVRLIGGPAGGALYGFFGFRPVVSADAASFLASAALVGAVRYRAEPVRRVRDAAGTLRRFAAELREGAGHARRAPGLPALMVSAWLLFAANAAISVLLVPYTARGLHASAGLLGCILGALGAGYIAGGPIARPVLARLDPRTAFAVGLGGLAVAFGLLFTVHVALWDVALATLIGPPAVIFLVSADTYLARHTPDRLMGRVTSVYGVVQAAAGLIGALAGSFLVVRAGFTATAWIAAAGCGLAVLTVLRVPGGHHAEAAAAVVGAGDPLPAAGEHEIS